MNKMRAKEIWDDTMWLWGDEKLRRAFADRFDHPKRLYRNMKRAWTHNRAEYHSTMAMVPPRPQKAGEEKAA